MAAETKDERKRKAAMLKQAAAEEARAEGFADFMRARVIPANAREPGLAERVAAQADRMLGDAEKRKGGPMRASGVYDSVSDSYSNGFLNISTNENGFGMGSTMFDRYSLSDPTIDWALWIALYNDSWVFRKAIDKPAEDEVTCGVTFHNSGDMTGVYRDIDALSPQLIDLLKWGAMFGGAVGFMMFGGMRDEDYAKPLQASRVIGAGGRRPPMYIYVTDRWYGCATYGSSTVANMADQDFGKPVYYSIMMADGHTVKVHHSYILRYEHRNAPRFMKAGMLQGWGYSEGAHILNELVQNDKLKTSVQALVDKALIEVVKMPGMRGVFMGTDEKNTKQLERRLEMVTWARNYNSLTFLDSDDEYQHNEFGGLAGLADLLEQNRWQIAAALDMQGILYGDMKSGLGHDEQAIPSYNKTILGRCNSLYRPVLQKLARVLFWRNGISGEEPDFEFNPVYKDEAVASKVKSINDVNALLSSLSNDKVISRSQYIRTLCDFINTGSLNLSFTEAEKAAAIGREGGAGAGGSPDGGLPGPEGLGGFGAGPEAGGPSPEGGMPGMPAETAPEAPKAPEGGEGGGEAPKGGNG